MVNYVKTSTILWRRMVRGLFIFLRLYGRYISPARNNRIGVTMVIGLDDRVVDLAQFILLFFSSVHAPRIEDASPCEDTGDSPWTDKPVRDHHASSGSNTQSLSGITRVLRIHLYSSHKRRNTGKPMYVAITFPHWMGPPVKSP